MSNILKVGRLHLVDRFGYTWLLWGVLGLTFLVNFAIYAMIPTTTHPTGNPGRAIWLCAQGHTVDANNKTAVGKPSAY